jgi:single-stranded DNA-specific DHH superfamily exonuclease
MQIELKDNDNILILHHWDCDGLCSAAILYRHLVEMNKNINVEFMFPKIGNYFLEKQDYKKIMKKNRNIFFVVDMALPRQDILTLKEYFENMIIFDHHKQEIIKEVIHINPNAENRNKSLDFPSTGWVINDYFNRAQDLLSVLGAIGDQEEKIICNNSIKLILKDVKLDLDSCIRLVKNIDSNYILNNKYGIKRMVKFLINNSNNISDLLADKKLLSNLELIEKEIKVAIKANSKKIKCERIIIKEIKTDHHIISNIARSLSKKYKFFLVIVINSYNSMANIYFRVNKLDIDLYDVIKFALNKGYNTGGKKEVAGVFVPREDIDNFINDVTKLIKFK